MVCLAKLPWLDDLDMAPRFACGATAYSAFGYLPPIADSLKALKFAGDRRSARLFGALLAAAASAAAARCRGASGEVTIPDVILPVPLHHERYVARGFNQSLLIARQLGHWLERPVRCDGLLRIRATPPQARLTAAERRHNVAGAFFVAPQLRSDLRRRGLRRVVLVDDVLTTGATLEAAALALLESGVREVQCWSFARTMPTKTTSPT